jgi:hypothetical protein
VGAASAAPAAAGMGTDATMVPPTDGAPGEARARRSEALEAA